MEQDKNPLTPDVLSLVHELGSASTAEIASRLGATEEQALDACVTLCSWGSIAPVYAGDATAKERSYFPNTYSSVSRDAQGFTALDGGRFNRADATAPGECWTGFSSPQSFYGAERSRTYCGLGALKRCWVLAAGILVNILCGFLLLMSVYSVIGVSVAVDSNVIGEVVQGSPAQHAGIGDGDTIVSINDIQTDSWTAIIRALDAARADNKTEIAVAFKHDGKLQETDITPNEDGTLGISVQTQTVRLNPIDSARYSFSYIVQTANGVAQLLIPSKTVEVLDQSTSIVGISIMSAQAAAAGPAALLSFAALISFSLGFMNLLPIPPLDGGKLVIELIQAAIRRPISQRAQNIVSYVGIALFGILFVYMLRTDILRFF